MVNAVLIPFYVKRDGNEVEGSVLRSAKKGRTHVAWTGMDETGTKGSQVFRYSTLKTYDDFSGEIATLRFTIFSLSTIRILILKRFFFLHSY